MHEYGIVQALLRQVEAEARRREATTVRRVRVRIGALSGVDPELLRRAYESFRAGSICAGADLEVVAVAARWVCPACDAEIPPGGILRCAACDRPARLEAGEEILLEHLELEVP